MDYQRLMQMHRDMTVPEPVVEEPKSVEALSSANAEEKKSEKSMPEFKMFESKDQKPIPTEPHRMRS